MRFLLYRSSIKLCITDTLIFFLLIYFASICRAHQIRILCIGDSLTKGYYDSSNYKRLHPYSISLHRLVSRQYGKHFARIDTKGVGGETVYYSMKKRLSKELQETKYDIVIVLGGINDLVNLDVMKTIDLPHEVEKMISVASKKAKHVLALTLLEAYPDKEKLKYVTKEEFYKKRGEVNKRIKSLDSKKIKVCDIEKKFPQTNVSGHVLGRYWAPDLIHPTILGYDRLGHIIFDCVRELFPKRKKVIEKRDYIDHLTFFL